jgi:membrane protein DedA with SNARE-associated domain
MGIPPRPYLVQDGLAASISVPVWVVAGWYFGEQIEGALLWARQFQTGLIVAVGIGIVVYAVVQWRRARGGGGEG